MSDVDPLLAAVLDQFDDPAPRLVLADWLEEQGDPLNLARAELLRLQVEREGRISRRRTAQLDALALSVLEDHPSLVGPLQPLLNRNIAPLPLGGVLCQVIMAGVAAVFDGPLQAGTDWVGHLIQEPSQFPTTLSLTRREGNTVEGEMEQDFSALFWPGARGRYFFRGVVTGRDRLVFVVHRVEEFAAYPGLYELTLKWGGWLTGTWCLPVENRRGEFRLRRQREQD